MWKLKGRRGVEGMPESKMKLNEKISSVYTMDAQGDLDMRVGPEYMERVRGEYYLWIGFNARVRNGGILSDGKLEDGVLKSKNLVVNKNGKLLLGAINEEGWVVVNSFKEGNWEEEYSFIGGISQGTVIDVVITGKGG
ncbi:hypothetical protein R5R35_013484 [Gryllus longicercus]|uniref:Uncharacterized protein n=1 Tax=Gryllus longicercus TaxID=2509291 RepID=A0AAN9VF56_9ORTH